MYTNIIHCNIYIRIYLCVFSLFYYLLISTVVFKFELLSTWGDPYYVGLSGIEFYDRNGDKILLGPNSILLLISVVLLYLIFIMAKLCSILRIY